MGAAPIALVPVLPDDTIPLPRHRRFDSGGFVAGLLALVLLGFGGLILGLAYGQRGGSTASPVDAPVVPAPPSATTSSAGPSPIDVAVAGPVAPSVPSPTPGAPRSAPKPEPAAVTAAGKAKPKKPHRLLGGLLPRR